MFESNIFLKFGLIVLIGLALSERDRKQQEPAKVPMFKFYQDEYRLVSHRVVVDGYNQSIVSKVAAFCYPFNRTVRAINVTIQFRETVRDAKVHIQVYKFLSNEYRFFPIELEFDYCLAMQQDFFDFASLRKCGNLATLCVFEKGHTYNLCKWIPDVTKFPPHMPTGDYQIEMSLKYKSTIYLTISWFGSFLRNA